MMKLLKYDFKRNGTMLLGITAVLILIQISLMLFIKYVEIKVVLSILAYVIAGVMLFTTTIRTYSRNLKAYHRKLLPVHTLKSILTPILMGCICLVSLGLIVVIHSFVYLSMYGDPQVLIDKIKMYPVDSLVSLCTVFVMLIHAFIGIFLAITIAASIRVKGSFWIGIVTFFLIVYGLTWIETLLFEEYQGGLFGYLVNQSGTITNSITVNYNPVYLSGGFIGTSIFELVCSVIFLYIMVKLIDRKVEV